MNKYLIFLMLVLGTIVLSGCEDSSSCLTCRGTWESYTDRAILNAIYLEHNKTYIDDLRFPATSIRVTGSTNIPDFEILKNGTYTLAFSPTIMEQAFLTMQTPYNRIDDSVLMPHFHWTYKTAGVGDVVWCMEYTCASIDGILPNTIQKCVTDTADGVFKHHMTDMINITNTLTDSSMCAIRVFRNATATADTFNQDALLLEFDIHYLYQNK